MIILPSRVRRGGLESWGEAKVNTGLLGESPLGLFGPLKSNWIGRSGVGLGELGSGLSERLESKLFKILESALPGAFALCSIDSCFRLAD